MIYFGFAVADSMFPVNCTVSRRMLTVDEVKSKLRDAVICCNPSHVATISAAQAKYGLAITVPERAPLVALVRGDEIIVMSVRGLPRLEGRHEYNEEEIEKASFSFGEWTVH